MMKKIVLILICFFMTNMSYSADEGNFDLHKLPFSHFGSYMSIIFKNSPDTNEEGLYLQDISGRYLWHWKGVFLIEPLYAGEVIEYVVKMDKEKLSLETSEGNLEITFQGSDILRFKSDRVGFRLTQTVKDGSSNGYPISEDGRVWRCQMGGYDHFLFTTLRGQIGGQSNLTIAGKPLPDRPILILELMPDEGGISEAALEQYQDGFTVKSFATPFEECIDVRSAHIDRFSKRLLPVPDAYSDLFEESLYLKWSSIVRPKGNIQRHAMYCSKNVMNAIWAWDNCFDAMACCRKDLDFSLDLIMVVFDHQSEIGGLPDLITDQHTMRGAFKPPIQGLTFSKIMEYRNEEFADHQLEKIYRPLEKYTNFWFRYMDDNRNGIPQYNHANDSGEDNCSVFMAGYPAEAPDLCTYLILQMDFLAYCAEKLAKYNEAIEWRDRSAELLNLMIKELWVDNRFVVKNSFTRVWDTESHAFLNYIPILLGDLLPDSIKVELITQLKTPNSIVTAYGPASEHPNSPYFEEDGYWRGAVWAPQYFFLVEGLKRCGEVKWAKELAKNYCRMCQQSGFPENFSALDGGPLKDSGYSWTASVFLMLAHEYLFNE